MHPAAGEHAAWYGAPGADPNGGGGSGTSTSTRGRRGPSWGGVVAVAAVAALLSGGIAFAGAKATDQTAAPASASSTLGGSSGGSSSSGGTAGESVPIGSSVDWGTVAQSVEPSVVTIQVSDGQTGGEGTGVIYDTSGHVVTNNHVATAATGTNAQIRIILSDGRVYQGKIAGTDPSTDLAVIQIQNAPSDLKPATFGDSSQAAVGQNVMAIGNPLGLQDTVTTGIISATDRPVTTQASESEQQQADPFGFNQQQQSDTTVVTNALQTDAAINPGNSGGPLVDAKGQVIGINSSIASTSDGSGTAGSIGLGFAIPGNEVNRVAKELIENGKAEHARLGVSMTSESSIATVDGTSRQAAEVAEVVQGGAAASAGIQQGDFITAVDGTSVTSAESLTAQIRSRAPGDTVTLTVVRGGQQQDIKVQLGSDDGAAG
ncbi:PDZ domain-containing protein [Streptomyces sp. NP160]|nr:PDZ domain-containing protein [Streptomyces sp. NP160]